MNHGTTTRESRVFNEIDKKKLRALSSASGKKGPGMIGRGAATLDNWFFQGA